MQLQKADEITEEESLQLQRKIHSVELLSPAGDWERLISAVSFGADAVYLGGSSYGMRTSSANFTGEELKKAVDYAHERNVKVYLTCNTLPRNDELDSLPDFIREAARASVDAFIVTDLGVFQTVRKYAPDTEIHVSTQAGIVNYAAANAFYEMGAKRVVLARELTLKEIKEIREKTNPQLEIECFVHGAMCVSYSGRCLLSSYLNGRDSNRGDCSQPCRWKYYLMEEKRPGEYYPVIEGDTGSHILNASDMCMLEHIPELVEAGITSFKIEGRAKSAYYTAVVTNAYRCALDGFAQKASSDYRPEQWIIDEVYKVSHRSYVPGFYYGRPENGQNYDNGGYIRGWDIVAVAQSYQNHRLTVLQRNRFFQGDELEVLQPGVRPYKVIVRDLQNSDGCLVDTAPNPMQMFSFQTDMPIPKGAILRKEKI